MVPAGERDLAYLESCERAVDEKEEEEGVEITNFEGGKRETLRIPDPGAASCHRLNPRELRLFAAHPSSPQETLSGDDPQENALLRRYSRQNRSRREQPKVERGVWRVRVVRDGESELLNFPFLYFPSLKLLKRRRGQRGRTRKIIRRNRRTFPPTSFISTSLSSAFNTVTSSLLTTFDLGAPSISSLALLLTLLSSAPKLLSRLLRSRSRSPPRRPDDLTLSPSRCFESRSRSRS